MFPNLEEAYKKRYDLVLQRLAKNIEIYIKEEVLEGFDRIDRISARAKSPSRFLAKANKIKDTGEPKYTNPLVQIQDQIGARVITFYLSDIEPISKQVEKFFNQIERRMIVPDDENEFGYEGKHHTLFIPSELLTPNFPKEHCPTFFELQIKTLFEHSWAEANHDLAYKPQSPLDKEQHRKIAFTAAQAWGADLIFDELYKELNQEK